MSLFSKKETIVLKNEHQKDDYIEKLANADIAFDVIEERDDVYSKEVFYIIRVKASDLKKVS